MTILKNIQKTLGVSALMLCCLLLAHTPAFAAKAGDVIMAIGQVTAKGEQAEHKLNRGDSVQEQDTVTTGAGSSLQLRFIDGGRITLRENSSLVLNEYTFKDASGKKDSVLMNLSTGGFRTITGLVKKNYQLKTPVASIGIRGTIYGAQLSDDQSELTVFIRQGSVVVYNEFGSILLDTTGDNPSVVTVKKGQSPNALPAENSTPSSSFRLPREEDDIRQSVNENLVPNSVSPLGTAPVQ
jgi:hypothetical protein